jgi:hypothetical protein
MTKLQGVLDKVLEDAFSVAMATLKEEAAAVLAATLKRALEARLRALLEEDNPTLEVIPPVRAKARATATAIPEEVKEEATKAPRRRKARANQDGLEEDLSTILEAVKPVLEKYSGVTTPRGKPLSEVLYRRVKKTLEHAQSLGRKDLPALARSALAHIASDPRGTAMGSWKALAERLGLPVHVAAE